MKRIATTVLLGVFAVAIGLAQVPAQAPPPPPGAFFFIQLSDPQFGFFTDNKAFTQETANFEFAVAAVNRLQPAFVVITGDLVNKPGDAGQIAEYQRIRAKIDPRIVVHQMAGNHDIENAPTPATVAAYRKGFGADHYTFRQGPLLGVVLNSTLIHTPDQAQAEAADQERWLRAELAKPRPDGVKHVIVFQHHPWFLKTADEADQYFNIPLARRTSLLALFRDAGVRMVVSGHYHQNANATDAGLESVVTGPVGKPLGQAKSGLRIFTVTDAAISHRYYEFGELPTSVVIR